MQNVNCPLCDGHLYQGDACGSCHAPAFLLDALDARPGVPRFVAVLGPSGAGKTVFLGTLLDLLARGSGGLQGSARGAYTLALQRNVALALESQRFPEKTPNEADFWDWAHCEVSTAKRRAVYDLVTPDVAGEAVQAELERPRSNNTVRALLSRSAGVVVLIDMAQVVEQGQSQELFALQLLTYLDGLRAPQRGKLDVPVAFVFTKADLFDATDDDAAAFARSNTPALWRHCESRLKHFRFDFAGVAGAVGRLIDDMGNVQLVPLRFEPRGVVEPFAWLVSRIA